MGAVPRRTAGFVTTSLLGRKKNELLEGPWSPSKPLAALPALAFHVGGVCFIRYIKDWWWTKMPLLCLFGWERNFFGHLVKSQWPK